MKPKKTVITNQLDTGITAETKSTYSTDVILDPQLNGCIVQDVLLIWLDQNIDNNSTDCRNTIMQLRSVVNNVNTFTDGDQCIQFLKDLSDEKACMLISDSFGQHIVPQIHNMSQVDSIFILSQNKSYHEQWSKGWSKIKGVFTEISLVCNALKQTVQECEQNAISISFLTIDDKTTKKLDQLEPSFMYTQIMKETLLGIDFEEQHIREYLDYCRSIFADNYREINNVKKLESKYYDERPIWWYTLECFLYPMLNRALRLMDVDIIIKMGFFIKDLYHDIEQLHREQFDSDQSNDQFLVYRGQGMSKTEFEQMTKTQGGLIAFNNFLSTSKNQSVSRTFANRALANPDLIGVLFIIHIDPSQSTTPFAAVRNVSAIKSEDEVLFAMQTVFRIGNIAAIDGNPRLYQVELTLTTDNDEDLRQLTDYIREETYPYSRGWYRLGVVLYKMSQLDKSEKVYQILLEQKTNESEKAPIYGQLGLIKEDQGKYQEAIQFYEKAVEILQKNSPLKDLNLAIAYNNIGILYKNMNEYSKALFYYEKSLEMKQQLLPPNDPDLAYTYINVGIVYDIVGEYSKALLYYEKSLEIQQQALPSNHPDLASSYNNIGVVYFNMNECSKALLYYEKALEIKQQSLPPNHSSLAMSYMNIGNVYASMKEYSKVVPYYEKSLDIWQQLLPPNHPNLADANFNIGLVYEQMGNYSKAYSSYEQAVNIGEQSLSPNHPSLQASRMALENLKKKL